MNLNLIGIGTVDHEMCVFVRRPSANVSRNQPVEHDFLFYDLNENSNAITGPPPRW